MLYETLYQGQIFLAVLYFGLIAGVVFEGKNLIQNAFNKNKIVCVVLDTAFMAIASLLFIFAKNLANYGEFRLYLLIAFVLGIVLEHISIGFLVEKFFVGVYTIGRKIGRKIFCYKPKSKFMQKLLK